MSARAQDLAAPSRIERLANPLPDDDGDVFAVFDAELFLVPSDSTPRIHKVIGWGGAWECDGPHCRGRSGSCKHVRRVLAARAGF